MTFPIVTNAEVVIVSAAAFLFAVVPAMLSLMSRPVPAAPPPFPLHEPVGAGHTEVDGPAQPAPLSEADDDASPVSEPADEPVNETIDAGVADIVEPVAAMAAAPVPLSPVLETKVEVQAEEPVAAAPPAVPMPQLPQVMVASDATAADWARFRLGDLRRARVDDLPRGVALDAAAARHVESIEWAAAQRPRAFAVVGVHGAIAEILLFEELWPATSADAFARIEVPLQA